MNRQSVPSISSGVSGTGRVGVDADGGMGDQSVGTLSWRRDAYLDLSLDSRTLGETNSRRRIVRRLHEMVWYSCSTVSI